MTKARELRFGGRGWLVLCGGLFLGAAPLLPVLATHSWGTAHWSRSTTLSIKLGDNVGTAWDTHLANAAIDWSKPTYLDMIVTAGGKDPLKCEPTYGKVEVCSAKYGNTGWLGLGQIWTSGDHIVQGTAMVNNTYFAQAAYNTDAMRRSVMCQEIGHTLGLDHQDVNMTNLNLGSCMDYSNDPSGSKGTNGTLKNTRPNAHDYDQLQSIYKHLDAAQLSSTKLSPSTSAATPGLREPPRGRPLLERGEWGRAVAADAKGRARVFVRDLGGDFKVTTFVIWAAEGSSEHSDDHQH